MGNDLVLEEQIDNKKFVKLFCHFNTDEENKLK